MGIPKQVDLNTISDLIDLIKRRRQGDQFHTTIQFALKNNHAVTFEILEQLYPGSSDELISEIISAGLEAHLEMVGPILDMIKLQGLFKELDNGEEGKS